MRGSTTFSANFMNQPRGLSANSNLTNYTHKLGRLQNEALLHYPFFSGFLCFYDLCELPPKFNSFFFV